MADKKMQDQLTTITNQLEQGVKDLFESGRYQGYLDVMSRFHRYSFNNTLLIAMQKPDATLVAGYEAWKQKFGRHVRKGEKGISIIAPSPFKIKEEVEKINPKTKEPILDASGQPIMEMVETTRMTFRVAKVFDVSQTEGRELPNIGVEELTGGVDNYDSFMKAIQEAAPVPIGFEEINRDVYGYYHRVDKRIAIQEGLSHMQTMKTAIHETAHALLHGYDEETDLEKRKDKLTMEVEAESIAYTVCKHYDLDTSLYSFGYIAGWSSDKSVPELRKSLETIRQTSAVIITGIDDTLKELLEPKAERSQSISFFVAEDGEFHNRGEYHDNLTIQEAIEKYKEIPSERMNAMKAIGFELHTGLEGAFSEISMELFYANTIGMEMVEKINFIRGNELIWEAVKELKEAFPEAQIDNQQIKEPKKSVHKRLEIAKETVAKDQKEPGKEKSADHDIEMVS